MNSEWFLVLVVGAILIAVVYLVFPKWKSPFWRELAEQTHLTYKPDWPFLNPHIAGVYRDFPVIIDNLTDYSPTGRHYIRITALVRNLECIELSAADKTFPLARLDQWTHSSSFLKLDDEELDSRLEVSGHPEDRVKEILTNSAIRSPLLRIQPCHLQIRQQQLQYKRHNLEVDVAHLLAALDFLILLARTIDQ